MLTEDDRWKIFGFYAYGARVDGNCLRCPRTAEIVESIPGITTATSLVASPTSTSRLTADRGRERRAITSRCVRRPTKPRLVSVSAAASSTGATVAAWSSTTRSSTKSGTTATRSASCSSSTSFASCRGTWRHRTARSSALFESHHSSSVPSRKRGVAGDARRDDHPRVDGASVWTVVLTSTVRLCVDRAVSRGADTCQDRSRIRGNDRQRRCWWLGRRTGRCAARRRSTWLAPWPSRAANGPHSSRAIHTWTIGMSPRALIEPAGHWPAESVLPTTTGCWLASRLQHRSPCTCHCISGPPQPTSLGSVRDIPLSANIAETSARWSLSTW